MIEIRLVRSLLRDRRISAGLTQQQLGDMIGKPKQRISEYEKTPVNMQLVTAIKLCAVFDCEISDLFVFEIKRT